MSGSQKGGSGAAGYRVFFLLLSAITFLVCWLLGVRTSLGQLLDSIAMEAVRDRAGAGYWMSSLLAKVVSEPVLVAAVVLIFGVAALRRRVDLGLRALLFFVLANGATQLLKVVLSRPQMGVGYALENSLPSGHVTVVATLVAALLVVLPRRAVPTVAVLGFLVSSAVGLAVISLGWHRPTDVIAAFASAIFAAMIALPAGTEQVAHSMGLVYSFAFSAVVAVMSVTAVLFVALGAPETDETVSHQQISELAAAGSPGTVLALSAAGLVFSFAALTFASIYRLLVFSMR